jgi:hypothetical protein
VAGDSVLFSTVAFNVNFLVAACHVPEPSVMTKSTVGGGGEAAKAGAADTT